MVLGGCTSGKVVGTGKPLSLALMLGLYRRKLCLYSIRRFDFVIVIISLLALGLQNLPGISVLRYIFLMCICFLVLDKKMVCEKVVQSFQSLQAV